VTVFFTAGRVGSEYRRCKHFQIMRIAVKRYVLKTGRDGVTRFKFVGMVEGTDTLDRYIRPKKDKLAKAHAEATGGVYRRSIKHNQVVPPLEALALEAGGHNEES
jgi:hypothetical protein